jgi:hypothetical protein
MLLVGYLLQQITFYLARTFCWLSFWQRTWWRRGCRVDSQSSEGGREQLHRAGFGQDPKFDPPQWLPYCSRSQDELSVTLLPYLLG